MASEIRITVADDHPILRRGLRQVIEEDPKLVVIGEAGDGESALAQIDHLRPDIAVLDIDMPKLDGLAIATEVRSRRIPVRMVFLTIHAGVDLFHAAMDLDARAYILKHSAVLEIVNGLLAVAAGQHYVSPPLTTHLLNRARQIETFGGSEPKIASLTASERHILRLIANNRSSKQIGDELCLHYRTVENRRTLICQKLSLHGNNALLKFALEHKLEL
ncbi:MAG: response regulator transcription factor [Acidobacteriaceae bacterium]|nr:response regulator transcription factor [Acidobacteriaceae bacterium]